MNLRMIALVSGVIILPVFAFAGEKVYTNSPVDSDELVVALRAAGAEVKFVETPSVPYSPEGKTFECPATQLREMNVNGKRIQVYEFADDEALEKTQVEPDALGIKVYCKENVWQLNTGLALDATHFYRNGKLIVLYIGSDRQIINLLTALLGPQFAGSRQPVLQVPIPTK